MIKIFLLVLFVLTSAFGEEPRVECPEDDVGYGFDWFKDHDNVASWEECSSICLRDGPNPLPSCNFWSWEKEDSPYSPNKCYLYETKTGKENNKYYISGVRGQC